MMVIPFTGISSMSFKSYDMHCFTVTESGHLNVYCLSMMLVADAA